MRCSTTTINIFYYEHYVRVYDIIQCVIKRVCAENHITPLQFDFIYW